MGQNLFSKFYNQMLRKSARTYQERTSENSRSQKTKTSPSDEAIYRSIKRPIHLPTTWLFVR